MTDQLQQAVDLDGDGALRSPEPAPAAVPELVRLLQNEAKVL